MSDAFNFGVEWDDKEFEKTFGEYLKWNKKQPAEIINAKLYFIALQAQRATKSATRDSIKANLTQPSRTDPKVSLAAILVNHNLRAMGRKGLVGQKLTTAVNKFIRKEQTHIQFLRSGWLPAIKMLDFYNKRGDITFVRRFAPKKISGVKQFGKDKGSVLYAKPERAKTFGIISNAVGQGKQDTGTAQVNILNGLRIGLNLELRSMRQYIERKYRETNENLKRGRRI